MSHYSTWLVSNGGGAGTGLARGGSGDGHTLSRSPPLSRKGVLRAGSSINAPPRDNRGGGGGGACLERVC